MKPLFTLSASFALLFIVSSAWAQFTYPINTIAGTGASGYTGDHGPATAATFNYPHGLDFDAAGNLYITDVSNNCIRKIDHSGTITTYAGNGVAGYAGDLGPATAAQLNRPFQAKFDAAGNLYFAETGNNIVRKVSATGIITTIAGTGTLGFSGDGGPASTAELNQPGGVALDAAGNVYVADGFNQRIRKIDVSTGIITTYAGNGSAGYSGDGGPATDAAMYNANYMIFDASENLYVSDNQNHVVRKITPAGIISTFAGNHTGGYSGDGVAATATGLFYPAGLTVDGTGNLYIADYSDHRIRMVAPSGIISTVAGDGTAGFAGDGGPATAAELNFSVDVVFDHSGNFFIADMFNNRIRAIQSPDVPPVFVHGIAQSLRICSNESATLIDTLLSVIDSNIGQSETWSVSVAPAHGTVAAAFAATSTGGIITPSGLTYAPVLGYTGSDAFTIRVTDGYDTALTTITVTVNAAPDAGIISGIDSVCPGGRVTLSETVSGGIWSTSSYTLSDVTHGGVATGLIPGRDTIIYTVINECGITSAIFPFTIRSYAACHTGIAPVAVGVQEGIQLYPNPATNSITITSYSPLGKVEVINLVGQVMLVNEAKASEAQVDISALNPGIYFVKTSGNYIRKFVKM